MCRYCTAPSSSHATGEPFGVEKSNESEGDHSSGPEPTMGVDSSRIEERQESTGDGSPVMETGVQDDTLLMKRTSELQGCSTSLSVDGDGATNRQSDSRSSLHRGVQKGPVGRWTRKKVAPKVTSGRPKRLSQKEKGSRVEELNQQEDPSSDPRGTAGGSCSGAIEFSVTTLDDHSSAEDRSGAEIDDTATLTDTVPHCKGASDFSTVASSLKSGQRSTGSVVRTRTRTSSVTSTDLAIVSDCVHDPSGQECTDEAISNTLNEVLQSVHTTAQLAPNDADLSGIVRSSLDLLCPPPSLSQVGEDTLIQDHPRPHPMLQESCSDNQNSGEALPSNSRSTPSTGVLSSSHGSNKDGPSDNQRTDSTDVVLDGNKGCVADSGSQQGSSAPSQSQEGAPKGGRKRRRRRSATKVGVGGASLLD